MCPEEINCALDFHHLKGNPVERVSEMAPNGFSKQNIIEEMEKCCVLCANCHRKYHAGLIDGDELEPLNQTDLGLSIFEY